MQKKIDRLFKVLNQYAPLINGWHGFKVLIDQEVDLGIKKNTVRVTFYKIIEKDGCYYENSIAQEIALDEVDTLIKKFTNKIYYEKNKHSSFEEADPSGVLTDPPDVEEEHLQLETK